MIEWLGEKIQRLFEWIAHQIGQFFDNLIEFLKGIATWISIWISLQWAAMIAWILSLLPPASPTIDNLFGVAGVIWENFWKYIQLAGYFIHFPTLIVVISIILVGETTFLIIQVYLFIKRLIPMA
jgi:hypothetical protein